MKRITQVHQEDNKKIRDKIKVLLKAKLTLLPKKKTEQEFKACMKFLLSNEEYETAALLRDKFAKFNEPYITKKKA